MSVPLLERTVVLVRRSLPTRIGVVVTATALGVLGLAAPAFAHVTISPDTATRGGDATVAFQVPNEEDAADTTIVEANLPPDKPIAAVAVRPVPGWTAVTQTSKLAKPIKSDDGEVTEAVTKITWTAAAGQGIKPGQFQIFDVSFDSLPDTDSIEFKVLQTYSDGTVVRWIDDTTPGAAEPDHPAPVLTLAKDGGDTAATAAPTAAVASTKSGSDGTAIGLGIAGVVLGLAGLVLGLLAYRRSGARAAA